MVSIWEQRAEPGSGSNTLLPDLGMVRRAAALFADPENGFEIRAVPSGRSQVCKGSDLAALVHAVEDFADDRHVFYCMNPLPVGLGRPARKADVLVRRWLLIDVDTTRPDPHANDPSTDAEKDASRGVAAQVLEYLGEQHWPAPVVVDSGNGWQLLCRVDLPNTPHAQGLVKALLVGLSDKFDSPAARVDRAVHNPDRLARLPGTYTRKGEPSADRPWRMAKLVSVPDTLLVVPTDAIAATVAALTRKAEEPPPRPEASNGPFKQRAGASDGDRAYGLKALDSECAAVRLCVHRGGVYGGRNGQLNASAFSLGQLVAGGVLSREQVESALYRAAVDCGLLDDPECGERGIRATIQSGLEKGMEEPRGRPERDADAKPKASAEESATDNGEVIIVRASTITPRSVEWLWPGRIPLGKLTTFAGVGGLGKTFVLCDIAARVSRGLDWPDSAGQCCEAGQVLFISGEDDPDDTLVPRLMESGADLERVAFLTAKTQGNFTLAAVKTLTKALGQIGPDTRLVVVDPPTSYLGDINDHKNAELRRLLTPLQAWVSEKRVAMIFNTHVNKQSGQKVEAMMRVMGSVAWVNAVRAAHMFTKDPEDPKRRLFIGMKLNVGKERKGLAYRLADRPNDRAAVEWLGEVDFTADEAMNKEKPKRRYQVAADWLEEMFADAVELPSAAIFADLKQTNISKDALYEAKDEMGVAAKQRIGAEGERGWWWLWSQEARARWKAKKAKKAGEEQQAAREEARQADADGF